MCGRYEANFTREEMIERYNLPADISYYGSKEFNPLDVRPANEIPVVLSGSTESGRNFTHMAWGYNPAWDKKGTRLINSKGYEIAKSFLASYYERRCVVPASAFIEWNQSTREKTYFSLRDQKILSLGGIWQHVHDKHGEKFDAVFIITMPPNELVKPVHSKAMALIIDDSCLDTWLDPAKKTLEDVRDCLVSYPTEKMHSGLTSPG